MGHGTGGNITTSTRIHPLKSRFLGKSKEIGVFLKGSPNLMLTHYKSLDIRP